MIARQTDSQTDRGERADKETTDRQTEKKGTRRIDQYTRQIAHS